jgi:predicted HTH domain antitoxin
MENINLTIPTDIFVEVNSVPKRRDIELNKFQTSLAIGMLVSREISLAKAAQLAGQSLAGFMETLKALDIPAIFYTDSMIDDDLRFANGS